MSTILLVYCRENADIAQQLAQDLGRLGIPFNYLYDHPDEEPGLLSKRVQASDDPVLLILTDNFLRNKNCLASALAMYQALVRQKRVLAVVADGRVSPDGGRTFERVPTQFDRVVHAIQYMNFWQSAYLDRGAGLSQIPPGEREQYEQDLDVVRSIANEIGELFSALRDNGYSSWAALEADDYALFFRHFGLEEWHGQYRKLMALTEEIISPLPEGPAVHPVAEIPAVRGLLVPAPAEPEAPLGAVQVEATSFNGMHQLLEDISAAEQTAPELPGENTAQSVLERLIETPVQTREADADQEVRQMIQDAWFWLEKGYVDRGLELFQLAVEQHPRHENLRSEYERALARFGKALPETKLPEPEQQTPETMAPDKVQEAASYDQMGENALAKEDYLLAKYCWDRVTELQPGYPGVYRKLALLTSKYLTDYKETAAHYLEEALVAEPNDADLHFRLGLLLRDALEQPELALQHFRDAVVLQPDHALAWLSLAEATLENDNPAEAETFYRQAIQLDPDIRTPEHDARFLPVVPEEAEPVGKETDNNQEESTPQAIAPPSKRPEDPTVESLAEYKPEPLLPPEQKAAAAPRQQTTAGPLTVLITGATSGIGRATAELFAREGHRVILTGRRADRLTAIQRQLESEYGSDVLLLPFDVRDPEAVRQTLENIPEAWQNIDILLNNAGLAKGLSPIHEGNLDHWETMIDTNLKGLLYVTRCIAPGMVRRRSGHIINIGSSAGKEVYAQGNVYCATKFAVDALTRAIRLDLHAYNIRVSQVSPGHVEETEFALNRFDGDAEKAARVYDNFQPLKPDDVAEAIYFIATRPPHVNIQDIWMFGTQQASATVVDRSGRN